MTEEKAVQTIHYNKDRDMFWFPLKYGEALPEGMFMSYGKAGASRSAAWPSYYPQGLLGVRAFVSRYGKAPVAADAAVKFKELKQIEEYYHNLATTTKYRHLFKLDPYVHQLEAIEFMLSYDRGALLLEQGLGKTFISLMALRILKEQGRPHRALVICPKIVFNSWLRETAKATDLRILPYIGTAEERETCAERIRTEEPDIVLTTFDMLTDHRNKKQLYSVYVYKKTWLKMSQEAKIGFLLKTKDITTPEERAVLLECKKPDACADILRKLPKTRQPHMELSATEEALSNITFFRKLDFDCLVVDEASRCINHKSARSEQIELLAAKAKRITLLSGTLCVGRPTDMFQPMKILDSTILGMNWTQFKHKYCVLDRYNDKIIRGYKNLDHLKIRIDPFILAKTREQCLDLPERIITQRSYTLPSKYQKLYDDIIKKELVMYKGHAMHVKLPVVKIVKCMQILGGFINVNDITSKVCADCEHLKYCVHMGIQPGTPRCTNPSAKDMQVITYPFDENAKLDLLMEDLEDSKDEKVIIWAWYRKELEDIEKLLKQKGIKYIRAGEPDCDGRFESDPECRVFLGQTAQGIGITLNSATCTIYYSHGTALEPRLQSMDRNHRIGQTKSVIVKDYVCEGTVEESIVRLLEKKREVRDFIQNVKCIDCYKYGTEQSQSCAYLQKNCVYYKARKSAEEKESIQLEALMEDALEEYVD